jgi:hypothetical protein
MLRASRSTDGELLAPSDLIGRFVWGAMGEAGGVAPLDALMGLILPLCEVSFAGESHYLVRITGGNASVTACGMSLRAIERTLNQPLCVSCRIAVCREGD